MGIWSQLWPQSSCWQRAPLRQSSPLPRPRLPGHPAIFCWGQRGSIFSPWTRAALAPYFCHPSLPATLEQGLPHQNRHTAPLPSALVPPQDTAGPWRLGGKRGAARLPVLQRELGQLPVVVEPLELQWPAALGHAREYQAIPLQVHLCSHRLRLEVGGHVICRKQRHNIAGYHRLTCLRLLSWSPEVPRQTGQVQWVTCQGHTPGKNLNSGQSDFRACLQSEFSPPGSPPLLPPLCSSTFHLSPLGIPIQSIPFALVSPSRAEGRGSTALTAFQPKGT